ncbi:MAG: hypothetical protein WC464_03085 [Bdellovibrionales bacterium]
MSEKYSWYSLHAVLEDFDDDIREGRLTVPVVKQAYWEAAVEETLPQRVNLTLAACCMVSLAGASLIYDVLTNGDALKIVTVGACLATLGSLIRSQYLKDFPPEFLRQHDVLGNVDPKATGLPTVAIRATNYLRMELHSSSIPQ